MSIDDLLAPVSEESPVGEDLLYDDAERERIELAFDDDSNSVDWREIVKLIEGQCGRTKDVWLATYLIRAGALMGKLETAVLGCQLLAGLFETYWDDMYPKLDEYGFQGRKGPCESLTKIGAFLGPLKRTVLVAHPRLGNYSGEDLQRFETEGDTAEGFGMFRRAIEETDVEELKASVALLDAMLDALRRADAVLMAKADGDTGTDFRPTYEVVDGIRRALLPYTGVEPEPDAAAEDGGDDSASAGAGGPRIAGRVESREDVIKAIDAVTDYYHRREPASPIPVALRRLRTWVSMDFMSILKDIAPNSVSEAGSVLLSRPDDDSSSDY